MFSLSLGNSIILNGLFAKSKSLYVAQIISLHNWLSMIIKHVRTIANTRIPSQIHSTHTARRSSIACSAAYSVGVVGQQPIISPLIPMLVSNDTA